jgi:hypothetical protein
MDKPFFCDMTALTAEQRARHRALAAELPEGYAARFAVEPATVMLLAEFVTLERLCCPCFTLSVTVAREDGPLSLAITGGDGVKPFIRAEFGMR